MPDGVCHLDLGLLRWARGRLGCSSLADVGCVSGGMVSLAESEGIRADGFDFSLGAPALRAGDAWDVAYSCEFLGLVPPERLDGVFAVFGRCRWVVMTAPPPGWVGRGRGLCHERWIREFNARGFYHVPELTREARSESTMNLARRPGMRFVRHRALVFCNAGAAPVASGETEHVIDGVFVAPRCPEYSEDHVAQNDFVQPETRTVFRSTVPLVGELI